MNSTEPFVDIEGFISLFFGDFVLKHSANARERRASLLLPQRIRLERDRLEKVRVDDFESKLNLFARYEVTFPELKSPFPYGSLKSDCTKDEAAVRVDIVVLKKLSALFQGQISAVDKVLVKLIPASVHKIDSVALLTIDNKENMWQRI